MNWLENNPLGLTLAGCCVVMLLGSAALGLVWSRPASSGAEDSVAQGQVEVPELGPANDLGEFAEYKGVNDRPLFVESRRPVVAMEIDESDVVTEVVADAIQ